jgi:hypothetical protein
MTRELESVLDIIRAAPATDLPRLLGELEEVRATGLARLSAPAAVHVPADRDLDDVLDVDAAADYIGMSAKWIYKHHAIIPHVRIGFGSKPRLKFRRRDLDGWIEKHRTKHSKHE